MVLIHLCFVVLALVNLVSANGGHSTTYRKQDNHGNYAFGYHIKDPWGGSNFRKESGDGWGNKHGSYGLRDVDGRERIVTYVADKGGFRAKIQTNEPGTGNIDAGDAIYNGADPHGHSHTHVVSGHNGHHGWDNGHHGHHGYHSHGHDGHSHNYHGWGHEGHHGKHGMHKSWDSYGDESYGFDY